MQNRLHYDNLVNNMYDHRSSSKLPPPGVALTPQDLIGSLTYIVLINWSCNPHTLRGVSVVGLQILYWREFGDQDLCLEVTGIFDEWPFDSYDMIHYPVGQHHPPPEILLARMGQHGLQGCSPSAWTSGIAIWRLEVIMCSTETLLTQ